MYNNRCSSRNADEMKALDSPFQSRKDRDILENDEDEPDDASESS